MVSYVCTIFESRVGGGRGGGGEKSSRAIAEQHGQVIAWFILHITIDEPETQSRPGAKSLPIGRASRIFKLAHVSDGQISCITLICSVCRQTVGEDKKAGKWRSLRKRSGRLTHGQTSSRGQRIEGTSAPWAERRHKQEKGK